METSLHRFESHLRSEEEKLVKWSKQVHDEDNRAQQNLKLAKELMAEANRKEKEVMGWVCVRLFVSVKFRHT